MANGWVIFEGLSAIDSGIPIIVVVTPDSRNVKTGPMWQSWILLRDVSPMDGLAHRSGADRAICGDCVHRGVDGFRSCYVNVAWAPMQVWHAYKRGDYRPGLPEVCGPIRLGAYGDPAAVALHVWTLLLGRQLRPAWTGYTHLWRTCDPRFQRYLMASVDSWEEANRAQDLGWRTYRVRRVDEGLRLAEIVCPASDEAGHRVTCLQCRLCMGGGRAGAKSIAIYPHGSGEGFVEDRRQGRLF